MIRQLALTHLLSATTLISSVVAANNPFETPDQTRNAFGQPYPSLTRKERREFSVGNSFFRDNWVQAPASTPARDGLGPTFNAVSCSACHQLDGRGVGVREGFAHVSLLFRLDGADNYGGQLNPFGLTDIPGEAKPYISFEYIRGRFEDGEEFELRKPIFRFEEWAFGKPSGQTRVSARVANQLIGLGLLEKIPASEIEQRADVNDIDQDGISGRAPYVLNLRNGRMELGRFGWKSEQPTVEQQSAAALNGDMGLTTHLFPQENCPAPQIACQQLPTGGSPEVDELILSRMTFYMQSLAVPKPRTRANATGERTFTQIGCASCHHPSYRVSGVKIFPFTDLLLHDMGEGLSDQALDGTSLATEWRTPPLWGIGLLPTVNGHTNLLHDGRARGIQEAILWHDGEARAARDRYMQLSRHERAALIEFVNSL